MGRVIPKDFAHVMKDNIEIYANEVNEDRAIPSVFDGLKPVQRRILYWLSRNKGNNFLGCAEVTGGVLGAFHPHGDSSVYGALVRLSQPLIMSYPLIDFHGNNGSITDPPAAMRYTKAKISQIGNTLLNDIDVPGVIEWQDNYNETQKEPKYLLGSLGTLNLLINPQIGIGVGLASNFTCHNIEDIKKVLQYRMENPNCKFEDLPSLFPSFHNAGILVNKKDIPQIYRTGRGTVVLRAKYKWDGNILHVTELPYRVDATSVKKYLISHPISGISEIFEQNGQLKIYVDPKANKEEIEKILLKKTALQNSYSVNMTATDVDGKPRVFNLLEILDTHIKLQHHRIIKCAEHSKNQCAQKLHIDEGLEKALDIIDEVIAIIRNSESTAIAESNLVEKLSIDNVQAKAILDIKLGRLAHMEIEAVRQEIRNLRAQIEYEEKVITDKELRESLYNVELSSYTDSTTRTECYDYISIGVDGDKISHSGFMTLDENHYHYWSDDSSIPPEETYFPFDSNKDYIFITNTIRGFLRKGTDLLIGDHAWQESLSLEDGEQILFVGPKESLSTKYEYLHFIMKDKSEYILHASFAAIGSSTRGKKLVKGKYDANIINPCSKKLELPILK